MGEGRRGSRGRRADQVIIRALRGLDGDRRTDFLAGLKALGMSDPTEREALRESARQAFPDYTEEQLDIFVDGEISPEPESLPWIV